MARCISVHSSSHEITCRKGTEVLPAWPGSDGIYPAESPGLFKFLHQPWLTQLPSQRSGGKMVPPRCQAAQSALLLGQRWLAAVLRRCTQVQELLHSVTELKEEVSRLNSVGECERDTLLELHPTFPGTGPASRQGTWYRGFAILSHWLSDSEDRGQLMASSCLVQQIHLLCDCPGKIGTKLGKKNWKTVMVYLAWRCCWG